MTKFVLAAAQVQGVCGEIEPNVSMIEKRLEACKQLNVTLLVFPECFLCGYWLSDKAEAQKLAVTKEGETMTRIRKFCANTGVGVCFGFVEVDNDNLLYNSSVLIDGQGEILKIYRKTHLWGDEEKKIFTPGGKDQYTTVELQGYRIGLLICYDIEFPEPSRCLGVKGVDLLVIPTANPPDQHHRTYSLARARAVENICTVAYVNRCGIERGFQFGGESVITSAEQDIARAQTETDALLVVTLNVKEQREKVEQSTPYLRDRRPSLYHDIC